MGRLERAPCWSFLTCVVLIDGSVNDGGLEHVSPLFSWVLQVQSLVKNGVLRPSHGLTCFPVGVFSVLLLLLGFLSRLFMHLIICAIRLAETDLQFFRGQTVPAHPLGNAVCNTAWTDRSHEKRVVTVIKRSTLKKTKPEDLKPRSILFSTSTCTFSRSLSFERAVISSAAHLCLPPAGSWWSTVWLGPPPVPSLEAPRAESAAPTRPPTVEHTPATAPVPATRLPSLTATETSGRHFTPTACKCDHVENKDGANFCLLLLLREQKLRLNLTESWVQFYSCAIFR